MTHYVQLFARARDLAGTASLSILLPPGMTVGDLRLELVKQCPTLSDCMRGLLIAVNSQYADDTFPLNSSAEIACFPPVSGG